MKQPVDSKRRMCCKAEEHIQHIVVRYTTLIPSEYTNRPNMVAGYIHWTIRKHLGLPVNDEYCKHLPARAINVNSTAIMWDLTIITD